MNEGTYKMFKSKISEKTSDTKARLNEYRRLKFKLANVLCRTPYCCLCLDNSALSSLNAPVFFKNWEINYFVTMNFVINRLFDKKVNLLASNFICASCKDSALSNYIYLLNTERSLEILNNFVQKLDKQICDINTTLDASANETLSHAVLVMSDPNTTVNDDHAKCLYESYNEDAESKNSSKLKRNYCKKELKSNQGSHYIKIVDGLEKSSCSVCNEKNCIQQCNLDPMKNMEQNTCIDYRNDYCTISHVNEKLFGNPYICSQCGNPLESLLAYKQHICDYRKPEACNKTWKPYQSQEYLTTLKHSKTHTAVLEYDSTKHFTEGGQINSAQQNPFISESGTGNNKVFSCSLCSYRGQKRFVLEAHVNRYHLKRAPYKCNECNKSFTTPFNLKCHLKVHTKNLKRSYVCSQCGVALGGPTALKKHCRRHRGERPYSCEHCGKGFVCSSMLKRHQQLHHAEKSIQCPLCPIMFGALFQMRTHVKRTHWPSGVKFDARKLKGLTEEQYDLFRDRRQLVLD